MNPFLRKTVDRSKPNRRDFFLQTGAASLGVTSIVNSLAQLKLVGAAAAQGAGSDYKALVCVFLNGGMDTNNFLIPISGGSGTARAHYDSGRGVPTYAGGTGGIAVPISDINSAGTGISPDNPASEYEHAAGYIPADGNGNRLGLHPGATHLKTIFDAGDLAFVCNVGSLTQPDVTRANYSSLPASQKPPQLFSHSDQQVQWQSSLPGKPFTSGWGGRVADILDGIHNVDPESLSMSVSVNGVNSFQKGIQQQPYVMGSTGVSSYSGYGSPYSSALSNTSVQPFSGYDPFLDSNYVTSGGNMNAGRRLQAFEQMMAMSHANLFDQGYVNVAKNARVTEGLVGSALALTDTGSGTTSLDTFFTNAFDGTGLNSSTEDFARQLKMVARLIIGNTVLNNKRQIFFVQLGGWDTHTSQIPVLNNAARSDQGYYKLIRLLSCSLKGFYDSVNSVPGLWNDVMAFTASDFTRTLTPNKTDETGGSDHGWGGHMMVMGGNVKGKRIYGTFPNLTANGGIDVQGNRGRWIPSTSVDQYSAVIAKWFGVSPQQMSAVFPNLSRFTDPFTPEAKLGFVDETV
ncbi:MAG: DUF1501 domain-containing protein [Prosthecobacter sp.]|nr:DUF1501 domain-containing protein [Prosthecobacter sp.]